nr:PREDICTED: integrator complex subunit 3 [Bemisia tabaci]
MDQVKPSTSRLFNTTIIDPKKDEIDEKCERCYQQLQGIVNNLSEKEAQNSLISAICKDKAHEEIVSLGLLVIILSEPQNAAKGYRDLTLVSRDGLALVLSHVSQIIERWSRLQDRVRAQLLWLIRELVRNAVPGTDTLCWNILRHAASGDISPRNLFLVEHLLDIFQENRPWLEKYPLLLASVVYSYLRFIEDHFNPGLTTLRQKEISFIVPLLRDKFNECLVIGRDLVRLLQSVAKIPEFELLWKDILHNPKSLSPNFTGVLQLLQTRTSRRFLQSRLTPEMERKLCFLSGSVRFGNHKRYQDWYQRQYLATPESQTLRCDLIRFIVGVIHPTNELLCSDIIPRWAIIGWLLTTCTSTVAAANAKLALFYDWFFFDSEKDNIMNIEPAILVMHHSMKYHPPVTASLLDFLCRIIPHFYPPLMEKVKNGVYSSLRQILEKRVLPSLCPIFDSDKLDKELRASVREHFLEFCFPPPVEGSKIECIKETVESTVIPGTPFRINSDSEPTFSDEEDAAIHDEEESIFSKKRLKSESSPSRSDSQLDIAASLEGNLRIAVENLHLESDNDKKCEAMEKLIQVLLQDEDAENETLTALSTCLCTILDEQFDRPTLPEKLSKESIEDSLERPIFVMYRSLTQYSDEDSRRQPLLTVLSEMYNSQPKIGYLLLYYLQATAPPDQLESKSSGSKRASVYKQFCEILDKELESCLIGDLTHCQDYEPSLLCWLAPSIYWQFNSIALNNKELVHLIVSCCDSRQLQELVCLIIQGRLVLFRGDAVIPILNASLNWETFEQFCFWQLVLAHNNVSLTNILSVLPRLDYKNHSEALTSIMLLLKREKPTSELVRQVLSRETRPLTDLFTVTMLQHWSRDYETLGDIIGNLLSSRCPAVSPNKRKRGQQGQGLGAKGGTSPPSAEKILGHLDRVHSTCKSLLKVDAMQRALQTAQYACTETQRSLYSNLFALLEPAENTKTTDRGKSSGRGRKAQTNSSNYKSKSSRSNKFSDSSDESSEEEEIVKPKQTKKRRKVNPVNSDSD